MTTDYPTIKQILFTGDGIGHGPPIPTDEDAIIAVDHLAAKALEVLNALAQRAARGETLTIAKDWGYGTATLIADGGHAHVGGDYWESAEENFEEFVRGMHDQLCCNRGL